MSATESHTPICFERDMVYGRKHMDKVVNTYDFRPYLRECFDKVDLDMLHVNNPHHGIPRSFGDDVNTWYHKTFYHFLDSTESGEAMKHDYIEMIKVHILPYLGLDAAYVQTFPSFRIQLPGSLAIARAHTDHELGHPIGEINFTYSFTAMFDTNTIYIETMPRSEMYKPILLNENEIMCFNGNLCQHFNCINDTGRTRISMDFRILPECYKDSLKGESLTSKKHFGDGGYYTYITS